MVPASRRRGLAQDRIREEAAPALAATHPVDELTRDPNLRALRLPLSAVEPNPEQPRKSFPQRQLEELEASIRQSGLIQPIIVRPVGDRRYQIVAGERRYRAYVALASSDPERFGAIPAVVQHFEDADVPLASLIENVLREDLNVLDRAEALKGVKARLETTWEGVAERIGISVRAVHFLVGVTKLPEQFKGALAEGALTEKHARALRKLEGDTAYDLFEYLLAHREVTGDEALGIAAVLRKDPTCTAEEAHEQLRGEAPPALPRPGPAATPAMQVVRGLKTFLRSAEDVDADDIVEAKRAEFVDLIETALTRLHALRERLR